MEEEGNEDTVESDAHVSDAEETSPRVRRATRNKLEPVKFQLGEYITYSHLSNKWSGENRRVSKTKAKSD